jgi:hypothetical protein
LEWAVLAHAARPHPQVVSYAVLDLSRDGLQEALTRLAAGERARHDRIDEVIESTVVKGIYEIVDVTDPT